MTLRYWLALVIGMALATWAGVRLSECCIEKYTDHVEVLR